MKRFFSSKLKLISLITAVAVIVLFSLDQTSWAAVIHCSPTIQLCNGTSGDDIIYSSGDKIIHGLGGNDYVVGAGRDVIYGDNGDDILIGSPYNDYINGGRGNDRIDGQDGSDAIIEDYRTEGSFVNNDDIISGGEGDDYIVSGSGSDKLHGGPGRDYIHPNDVSRDFSFDYVNCGSGTEDLVTVFTGDGDTTVNCETVYDRDR